MRCWLAAAAVVVVMVILRKGARALRSSSSRYPSTAAERVRHEAIAWREAAQRRMMTGGTYGPRGQADAPQTTHTPIIDHLDSCVHRRDCTCCRREVDVACRDCGAKNHGHLALEAEPLVAACVDAVRWLAPQARVVNPAGARVRD